MKQNETYEFESENNPYAIDITIEGDPESKGNKRPERLVWSLSGMLSLCVSVLVTAVILQTAELKRSICVPDDALPSPLLDQIHPAALLCLAAAYGISIAILAMGIVRRSPGDPQ